MTGDLVHPDHMLIVSGLDPSGGAGFLVDVRVAEMNGLRPVGAVSALTVQTTAEVREVRSPGAELLGAQLTALLSDVEIAVGKIGLVADEECSEQIARALALTSAPVVWDPVVRASAGGVVMFKGDPIAAFEQLAPHLTLVTPNLAEAELLSGIEVTDMPSMIVAGKAIAGRGPACLVTGGHLPGDPVIDILVEGNEVIELSRPRIDGGEDVHGTGCMLSSTIAALLAQGKELRSAVRTAGELLIAHVAQPVSPGRGASAVL